MVMSNYSDSDDTDVLLLIPPDFFFSNPSLTSSPYNISEMSNNYNYLPPRHRIELENIDAQLNEIEKNFPTSSNDPVAIGAKSLNYENQNDENRKHSNLSNLIYHSTPKCRGESDLQMHKNDNVQFLTEDNFIKTDNIINEIDNFLEKNENFKKQQTDQTNSSNKDNQKYCLSLSSLNPEISSKVTCDNKKQSCKYGIKDDNLISLSEIWNENNTVCNENLSFQEERLRRQHCEKIIQVLQHKLLEYQQKLSVAIQVDKAKDNALEKIQGENCRLETLTNELDNKLLVFDKQKNDLNEKLLSKNEEFKKQKESLEQELSQALKLISKFQDKNEILEIKVDNLTRASTEVDSKYKKEIEDMKLKLSTYKKNEEISKEEFNKMNINYENLQTKYEEKFKENVDLKKKLETQIVQNNKFDEMKKKLDELEKRNKLLEECSLKSAEKEKGLMKELESQRITLKSHYQQQLESVVARKLKEYQLQLDTVEETLRTEAKERERIIAERAIKQVELINEKNEQEIMLLKEKHKQEVELYRIQLANSCKKINNIEKKLEAYRSRRADIAERLHNVMETQWRKALEILTNPNNSETNINDETYKSDNEKFSTFNSEILDENKLDGLKNYSSKIKNKSENERFESQSSVSLQSNNNYNNSQQNTIDRLQAYIEMLLNKSPSDLDNLKHILAMPKVNHQTNKSDKHKGVNNVMEANTKPPWK